MLARAVDDSCHKSVRALHGQADIARCGGPLYDKPIHPCGLPNAGAFLVPDPVLGLSAAFSESRVIRPELPRKRARAHRPREVCGCLAQPSKTGVRETLSAIGFSKRLLRGGRVHLNSGEITANAKEQLLTDLLVRSLIRQTDVDRQFRSRRNDSITAILTVVEHATHAAVTLLYITALWSGAKA